MRTKIFFTLVSSSQDAVLLQNEQLNVEKRKLLAQCLGTLSERSIVPDLLRLLENQSLNIHLRFSILEAAIQVGEKSLIDELITLLTNLQFNENIQIHIVQVLEAVGDSVVIEKLLPLLEDQSLKRKVRTTIVQTIGALTADEITLQKIASLLFTSDIPDGIHTILWSLSRKIGVNIVLKEGQEPQEVELVKW